MTTLKQFLNNTQDVTVHVPKTTSFFYVTKGTETMALVNFNLDTPVFVPTEKTDFSNCAKHVFEKKRLCIDNHVSIYQNTYSRNAGHWSTCVHY